MAYATLQDMIARYGEEELIARTDRVGAGAVDRAVAERALDDASVEIDAYLGTRYRLPLPQVPGLVVRLCCAIARYRLWEDLASERVREDYQDARRVLEGLARGTVTLGMPDAPREHLPTPSLSAARSGPEPVFGPEGMSWW